MTSLSLSSTRPLTPRRSSRLAADRSTSGYTTAADLKDFLVNKARFPLFGKPQDFSGSFGSALISAIEGDALVLGNGRRVNLDAFCQEIVGDYASGYIFQTALSQHADMSSVTGDAVGSIRIATVRQDVMPEVLYSSWKIPAPKAMSDNFWQDGSMIAPVDITTGQVGQCRIGTGLNARNIDTHPVSGKAITGMQLPCWDEACTMAREVHAMLPEFGVIGWDIAVSPEGPLIIECNTNPIHTLYQLAHCRGIYNDDFTPVFDRVAARSKQMLDDKMDKMKKRGKELRRRKKS